MDNIKSFQDLNIWKEAHSLTLMVYKHTANFPADEKFGMISQLRRASSSIPANIAEGMGRNTTKELLSFTYNARGSLSEVIYHLILSKDLNYISEETFKDLYERYNGLGRGINVFIAKLKPSVT
ncbi:MAG: four helix bundle protein [bacterium]